MTVKACCRALEVEPLDAELTEELATAFRALGDPHRAALVQVLAAARGPVCVCDLEEHLPLSQPTVSHHLRVLMEAGLLDREQSGRWAYYSVRPSRLDELRAALGDWAR